MILKVGIVFLIDFVCAQNTIFGWLYLLFVFYFYFFIFSEDSDYNPADEQLRARPPTQRPAPSSCSSSLSSNSLKRPRRMVGPPRKFLFSQSYTGQWVKILQNDDDCVFLIITFIIYKKQYVS